MKKSLLASVAAAALIASPGLAFAQKQEAPSGKSEAPARAPAAVQNAPAEKIAPGGPVAPKAADKAADKAPNAQSTGQAAPASPPAARNAADGKADIKAGGTAAPDSKSQGSTAAQSSGGAVALTADQKAKIRTSVLTGNAPRVTSVNFSLNIGTVVPRTVRVAAVPATLVEIHPAWRGYMYFVHGDEIVIVEPGTLRIVAVIQV